MLGNTRSRAVRLSHVFIYKCLYILLLWWVSHGTCSGVNAPMPCLALGENECESIVPESIKGLASEWFTLQSGSKEWNKFWEPTLLLSAAVMLSSADFIFHKFWKKNEVKMFRMQFAVISNSEFTYIFLWKPEIYIESILWLVRERGHHEKHQIFQRLFLIYVSLVAQKIFCILVFRTTQDADPGLQNCCI